jgi:hypothetical protein
MTDTVTTRTGTKDTTTIPLSKTTRDEVKGFGKKGESWDLLLKRMCAELKAFRAAEVK